MPLRLSTEKIKADKGVTLCTNMSKIFTRQRTRPARDVILKSSNLLISPFLAIIRKCRTPVSEQQNV